MSTTPNLAIDSRVEIIPHSVVGFVSAIYIDRRGAQFQIEYKDQTGAIQSGYYSADQLRAAN